MLLTIVFNLSTFSFCNSLLYLTSYHTLMVFLGISIYHLVIFLLKLFAVFWWSWPWPLLPKLFMCYWTPKISILSSILIHMQAYVKTTLKFYMFKLILLLSLQHVIFFFCFLVVNDVICLFSFQSLKVNCPH